MWGGREHILIVIVCPLCRGDAEFTCFFLDLAQQNHGQVALRHILVREHVSPRLSQLIKIIDQLLQVEARGGHAASVEPVLAHRSRVRQHSSPARTG